MSTFLIVILSFDAGMLGVIGTDAVARRLAARKYRRRHKPYEATTP